MPFNPATQPVADPFRGLGIGMQNLAQSLERGLERQKADAKLFKTLQEVLEARGVASKDQTTTMDLDTLIAKEAAARVKEQMEDHARVQKGADMRNQINNMILSQQKIGMEQTRREQGSAAMFDEWVAQARAAGQLKPDTVMEAGWNSGLLRVAPQAFAARYSALFPERKFSINDFGRAIPTGLPNKVFVPTSPTSGQLEDAKPATPERVRPVFTDQGKPTPWVVTPGGQYLQNKPTSTRSADEIESFEDTVIKAKNTLKQLADLKKAGVKKVDIDVNTGSPRDAGWWGGTPIDDAIRQEEARMNVAKEKAGMGEDESSESGMPAAELRKNPEIAAMLEALKKKIDELRQKQ